MLNTQTKQPSEISISVSAPGKVILHGEHSVVYDKLAVAASLGLRTKLKLQECPSQIRLEFPAINFTHSYDFNDLQTKFLNSELPLVKPPSNFNYENPELINHSELLQRIENYISISHQNLTAQQKLAVSSFLYLFAGIFSSTEIPIKPFSLKTESELSVSSGCGSSASFSVCLVASFIHYIRLKSQNLNISKSPYKPTTLTCTDLKQFDDEYLKLISRWAFCAEKIIHGLPSGIDNTICTYGSAVAFRKSTGHKLLHLGEFQLLLVNTNVQRDTKRLVAAVASLKQNHSKIVELILNTLDEVSHSAIEILKEINDLCETDEMKIKCLYDKLGEVIDMNQHLLQALGVSHQTLDKICFILKRKGICGKLTGAGGGGYAIAVIPSYVSSKTVEEVIIELKQEGFDTILTTLGGAGVTID